MPMLNHAGRFIAQPAEWTVEEGGQNKLPTFVCRFNCVQQFNPETDEWEGIQHEEASITGYFYLIKKDGNENQRTIDDIKSAIGWDGRSFASLVNGAWNEVECQITTEFEQYNGKSRLKIKWLNPRDYVHNGGLEPASPQLVQSLDSRYGARLRALAGAPAAPSPTKPVNGAAAGVDAAKRGAWTEFQSAWTKHVANVPADASFRDARWKELVGGAFGNRVATGAVSVNEWKLFGERIKAYGVTPPSADAPPDDMPGDVPPAGLHKQNKAARQAAKQPAMAGPAPEDDPSHPDYLPI